MIISRRNFIKSVSASPVAIGAMSSILRIPSARAASNFTPTARLGSITGNDPQSYVDFQNWFGRKPQLAHLYFNQTSASALSSSISYICQQGAAFIADGAQILWSVPCPGAGQLEAIIAGNYNSLYTNLFQSILKIAPQDSTAIYVRLPWEFNLSSQTNAAKDKHGNWNGSLFYTAWQKIAKLCKAVSPRFQTIWCPNVCTQDYDPQLCWAGMPYVDIVAQDFYMQSAYDKPGFFNDWFLTERRGLAWGLAFAKSKQKPYGVSEWGMDSDAFIPDFNNAAAWLKEMGAELHHHNWWDRTDGGINCQISAGALPGLAAAYKNQFV